MVAKSTVKKSAPATESTRITLSIDKDIHLLIRERARESGVTMGKIASQMIRDGAESLASQLAERDRIAPTLDPDSENDVATNTMTENVDK